MCYRSEDLTDDLDILIPHRSKESFLKAWPSIAKHFSTVVQPAVKDRASAQFMYGSKPVHVDFIVDSLAIEYGDPNPALPFRLLLLTKLIEHYFYLLDSKNLSTAQ